MCREKLCTLDSDRIYGDKPLGVIVLHSRTCGDTRLVFKEGHLLTAAGKCLLTMCLKPERVRCWARALRNSSGTLTSPRMESHARRLPATVFQRVRTRCFLPFPITRRST